MSPPGERLPLRERKKAATRARILEVAQQLFEQRGYDDVTVAEIADGADVSVKTLFVYFRSKEDLAFADTALLDALVAAVRSRERSPARAVGQVLEGALDAPGPAGLEGYFRRAGDAPALRSRLLRLWAECEDAVAEALADESPPEPADRLAAIALVGIVRSFTAPEVRRVAAEADDPDAETAALRSWLADAVRRVELMGPSVPARTPPGHETATVARDQGTPGSAEHPRGRRSP
ncbi:TetR/AcrR family transcriptional regulator [Actinomycetospora endophytica]|uniref:TetR/AcrR family transcriptional regulator n=1 Tax=Actinomycetospora endophytica TaxID=2291215 RepID=A0ABS8PGV4_9PSEU|nr:TetR/AcrR family transcriptional regulator [Actinomycetospora endophytica]MCD2197490.1 TetR/AcrR family transcriptional regulator [Actinomycetospora endophytica]